MLAETQCCTSKLISSGRQSESRLSRFGRKLSTGPDVYQRSLSKVKALLQLGKPGFHIVQLVYLGKSGLHFAQSLNQVRVSGRFPPKSRGKALRPETKQHRE